MGRAKSHKTIRLGKKSQTIEIDVFPNSGHTNYSGFGFHDKKTVVASRRDRKLEENRIKRGQYADWD